MGSSLMEWRLADAKNRFSELVSRALAEGPQRVLRRDEAVIVLAERDFDKLTGRRLGVKEFLMGKGPSVGGLDLAAGPSRGEETSRGGLCSPRGCFPTYGIRKVMPAFDGLLTSLRARASL